MKKIVVLFVLLFASFFASDAFADNCVSSGSDDWDATVIWGSCSGTYPTYGDTATISVGDTVTLRGDQEVGTSPADAVTYDLKVYGTLVWATGESNTLTSYSSVRVYSGGKITIDNTAECDGWTQQLILATSEGYGYGIVVDSGGQLELKGCANYPSNYVNDYTRARITACSPNCGAGVVTFTLDTAVAWTDVDDPTEGSANPSVMIGCGGGTGAPAANCSERVPVSAFPAANQITVTTANDHQIGDFVANLARDVVVRCDDTGTPGTITTTSTSATHPFEFNWARIHGFSATTHTAANTDAGSIDYTAFSEGYVTMTVRKMTSYTWNAVFNGYFNGAGTAISIEGWDNLTAAGGVWGIYYNGGGAPIDVDGGWFSGDGSAATAAGIYGNVRNIENCVIHNITDMIGSNGCILVTTGVDHWWGLHALISNNEIRHCDPNGIHYRRAYATFKSNEILDVDDTCLKLWPYTFEAGADPYQPRSPVDMTFVGNTYDGCNNDDTSGEGALEVWPRAGRIHIYGDNFGSTEPNGYANILFNTSHYQSYFSMDSLQFACNECILEDPDSAAWSYPAVIKGSGGTAVSDWEYRAYLGANEYLGFQNINGTGNNNFTFGPGGSIIEYEAVTTVDNTLNLKITPFSAALFARVPVRRVYVQNGDDLTVTVYLRKNEALAAGRRPRLVLMGPGFDPTVKYDEMSDAIDTFEQVTVTGTANATGIVYIYVDAIGVIDGGGSHPLEPVDPPTLIIYADGIEVTKS